MKSLHVMWSIAQRMLLAVFLLLFARSALADVGDRVEVSGGQATLFAAPSAAASPLMTLTAGEKMVEMERQGGWVFVSLKRTGDQGWVRASLIRLASAGLAAGKVKPTRAKSRRKARSSKRHGKVMLKAVPEPVINAPEAPFATHRVSLQDLGFHKGTLFEGAGTVHQTTFFFPAPLDSRVTNGSLRLLFRASPGLLKLANIRVSVNGLSYKQMQLPQDGGMHEMDVLLPPSVFQGKLVKVVVNAFMPVSDDRCFDDRLSNIYLHIMPQSSLSISYKPLEQSIRDAWRLLPQKVTISLSDGQLSKEQFASTLALMALLADKGKEVKLVRLPTIGDIVVAPKAALAGLVQARGLKTDKNKSMHGTLDHPDNLMLVRFANRSAIVLTDPYDVEPMYLLDDNWKILAAGDHYRVYKPDDLRAHDLLGTEGKADYYSLPLSTLGMNTVVKYLSREVSWQTLISPYSLPLGTQPDFLNLNIVAPVRLQKQPAYEMYVFLNDVLVKSARLADTGLKQHFTVNLPSEYQKQFNNIRVVVKHDIYEGNCKGLMPTNFVQLMPDSALVVKTGTVDNPAKFSDLSRYFQPGFDTYLNTSYLSDPDRVLHLMAQLAADFPLMIDQSRLHFIASSDVLNPDGPFVAVGHFGMDSSIDAPVRFDKGHVKILTPTGKSYFDVNNLSKVTVAEIVKTKTAYGLWVMPANNAKPYVTNHLKLAEDNVAFIDSHGVIKTMNSAEPTLAHVYYPDTENWFDVLGKYKFWLMVALWFLLTMVVVYLYRMSKANKVAREQDDATYRAEAFDMQKGANDRDGSLDHLDERR